MLEWITELEIDNDYFELEKSTDAQDWDVISVVQGAGNSTDTEFYSSIDYNPAEGLNFYRLRQVDFDGDFDYSEIISIDYSNDAASDFSLFPNPAASEVVISAINSEISEIVIFNSIGQEMPIKILNETDSSLGISIEDYPSGMYFIRSMNGVQKILFKK